ncbi:MAG: hypothetical protein DI536_32770 [Archangium gephyra]|uniref:Uncharacterized protein n=1 Tax=Archangium gephyra TaxID=48 RepID=A0A2W5UPL2_9BACT|nr:MAG: hypothetical protein DI536_32770 [Archangium gephyra]
MFVDMAMSGTYALTARRGADDLDFFSLQARTGQGRRPRALHRLQGPTALGHRRKTRRRHRALLATF